MKPVARDFLTGVTVIAGIIALVFLLFVFGELTELTSKTYKFNVQVSNAGGLAESSRITLNGVRVGKIESATVAPPPEQGALLTLKIQAGTVIPRAAQVFIDKSFVGDASLEFTVPATLTPAQIADVLKPGETFNAGEPNSLIKQIVGMVEQPLARLTKTAEKIDTLAERYTMLGDQLVDLTKPRTTADVAAGADPNLRTVVARLDSALAGASKWMNDSDLLTRTQQLLDRSNNALSDAEKLAEAWTKTAATLEGKADAIGKNVETLTSQAVSTLQRTEKAAGELSQILESANKGQGTVGQLLQNPDLYNSLKDAAQRLDRTLVEFQLLIEKFKNEGVPIKL